MPPATRTAIFASLAGVLLLAAALLAQERSSFRSNVEIAVVSCAVVNANGEAVRDLTRGDFQVYDNDVRRPIGNFWIDTDQPLTLGVLVDASESQQDQIDEHRRTVGDLLTAMLRPGDRAFAIRVGEQVSLWMDMTDAAEVRARLMGGVGREFGEPCGKRPSGIPGLGATPVCGSSPLWNAIYDAARIELAPVAGNKALLMLTDGFDSGSTRTWNQAADAVNRADASLYAVQYRSGFGGTFAPDLYRLVKATGGTWFGPPNGDYRKVIVRLETDLRRRYVLGFPPEKLSGKRRHDVRIEVSRADAIVRARKTYFDDEKGSK